MLSSMLFFVNLIVCVQASFRKVFSHGQVAVQAGCTDLDIKAMSTAGHLFSICVISHPTAIDGTHGALTAMNLDHQMICLIKGEDCKVFETAKTSHGKPDTIWCYSNSNGFSKEAFDITGLTAKKYGIEVRTWDEHLAKNPKCEPANAHATQKLGTIKHDNAKMAMCEIESKTKAKMPEKYIATPTHGRDCHRLVYVVDQALQKGEIANGESSKGTRYTDGATQTKSWSAEVGAQLKSYLPTSWGFNPTK